MRVRTLCLAALLVTTAGCDGDGSPTSPFGGSGGGIGGGGSTSVTALVDGTMFRSSQSLSATYSTPGNSLMVAASDGNLDFSFSTVGPVGTTNVGPQSQTSATLRTLSGLSGGEWVANSAAGRGSVTIATLTSTRATGTFSFTLVPSAGTTAVGERSVTNGTFTVRFD